MQGEVTLPDQLQVIVAPYWQRLAECPDFKNSSLAELLSIEIDFSQEINQVWAASDFVANAVLSNPLLLQSIFSRRCSNRTAYFERLESILAPLKKITDYKSGIEQLKSQLRNFHRLEFILIIWRDICRYAEVHEVCQQMSELADASLQATLEILHAWCSSEWGQPMARGKPQSMVVIGMGKLGANELNVSSDIDLIFAYPETGTTDSNQDIVKPLTNQQYFTRLGQRLIDTLDSTTAEGFVFRMDMRLRPYGSEGALALNFDAMEDYYQSQGRDWERYALIKARIVAGDIARGTELLKRLKPFVYRRYLDFAMFESLRDMKLQIDKQARRGKQQWDIKLGSGGIREVEFIIQALQLVYGGRDITLQQASILIAAKNLTDGGYLPQAVAQSLLSAYDFLRKLEHRLQAFANQQTQTLPSKLEHQLRIAFAMGFKDWGELQAALNNKRDEVSSHFHEILKTESDSLEAKPQMVDWSPLWNLDLTDEEAQELLGKAGFEDSASSSASLQQFRKDKKFLLLSAESKIRLNTFMPVLLEAVSNSDKPSLCLSRVLPLVEAVSRRTAYLVLLLENPQALEQLVLYCTASPFISDYLSKFPVLLDELLHVLDEPPEKTALVDEIKLQLLRIGEDNFEDQLNCLRYFKQSHQLQVAAAEVSGKMPLMKVSDYLTFIAEVILDAVLALSWQHLVSKHGFPVHTNGKYGEPDFAILGYGKLGGIELGYNSDLDLVFLHQAALDKDTIVSDTQTSINSRAFYIKLAQRIILMLGTYTMAGKLYEVDMRLRPSGDSGLLVSSIESFLEYQLGSAWTWEHQALVRARGIAGNDLLLKKFLEVRTKTLAQERLRESVMDEVVSMRNRMRNELSSKSISTLDKLAFEIKQGVGGIVDIEFLVQYLVLVHAHRSPALLTYTDNFRILEAAQECQLLDQNEMQTLIDAYLEFRSALHQLALQTEDGLLSTESRQRLQSSVSAIWDKLFSPIAGA